ncbi:MAG: HD domain-containing protein [Spirochaetales bacterium]|nr:HD domain-containing protein [Spirochaetales bacterium]
MRYKINKDVKEFADIFYKNGFRCYLVGGAVRNLVGGFGLTDMDFTTNATPEQVMKLFRSVIPTGIKHGTVTVLFKGQKFEVTTFRIDEVYTDGRRPDSIAYTDDLSLDLQRRDFTINSIALDLKSFKLFDPNNGKKDIKQKIIKAIGEPKRRFDEDGLRILRCFRFSAQLGFEIEAATFDAARECRNNLKSISFERIRDELKKIILSPLPSQTFISLHKAGILEIILPELDNCWGVEQKGYHKFDVFLHSVYACDFASNFPEHVKIAALLHDIGKPAMRKVKEDGVATFHMHERKSADLARKLMGRLKFSNSEIQAVTHLIENHMFHYTQDWTDSAVKRFIGRVGIENIDDLFALREADKFGMDLKRPDMSLIWELKQRIRKIIDEGNPFSIKDLKINGSDLIAAGIEPGPQIGEILNYLLEAVIDDAALNSHEVLVDLGKKFYQTRLQ